MSEPDPGSLTAPEPAGGQEAQQSSSEKDAKRIVFWVIRLWMIEVVVIVAAAFVLALLVQAFIVKPFAIPSPSMENTLLEGDRVLVNRLVYHFHPPRRGDVIVFHPPGNHGSDPFIKRVVAVGGDTIAVHDGTLYVNGMAQDEPYLKDPFIEGDYPETEIETGYVWAMGDNRNNSGDSRVFGPVPLDAIMGEAFAKYWPISRIGGL